MAVTLAMAAIGGSYPLMFNTYEEDYMKCSRLLNKHINDLSVGVPPGGLNRVLAEADTDFVEAEGYVKAMDVEVRTMQATDKKKYREKLGQFRSDLQQLRRDFDNARARVERQLLLTSNGTGSANRIASSNERLLRSTAQLQESRRVVYETEDIGINIISEMEGQRRQLQNANEKVSETKGLTADARRILNNMHYRAISHKACMMIIIAIQLILIGVVFYYGIIKRHKI